MCLLYHQRIRFHFMPSLLNRVLIPRRAPSGLPTKHATRQHL